MSETNTPRLMAAAKEFNIGKDTLVDFLVSKGFSKDDLKPTSKLAEDMYRSLQLEFSSDKAAKMKSDQIEIPKGSVTEAKKKKDEEEILFKKESKKKVAEKEAVVAVPAAVAEVEVLEVAPPPPPPPPPPPVVPEVAPIAEPAAPENFKIEAPELASPKVLDKIDLDAIDSSTRPKKSKKAEPAPAEPTAPPPPAKKKKQPEAPVAPEPIEEVQPAAEEAKEVFIDTMKIEAPELEGPKIVGRIELPVENDQKNRALDEKRKRKRIPIEKKGAQTAGQFKPTLNKGGQGQARPAAQGGAPAPQQRSSQPSRFKAEKKREVKEIDEKEIQEKIRQTQANLPDQQDVVKVLKLNIAVRNVKRWPIPWAKQQKITNCRLQNLSV
jgi:translation initiation factor IF-2